MGAGQGSTGLSASNPSAVSMQTGSMGSSTGNSGLSDLYRIQIEAGDLENNIAFLKSRRNSILAQFNSYLNRPVASMVSIPETISPDSLGLSLIAVSDSILANNPMLEYA